MRTAQATISIQYECVKIKSLATKVRDFNTYFFGYLLSVFVLGDYDHVGYYAPKNASNNEVV